MRDNDQKRASEHQAAKRLSLHFVEGQGLLLDPVAERLYSLNTGAALVWSLVKEGRSPDEICRALTLDHGVAAEDAAGFLSEALGAWRDPAPGPRTPARAPRPPVRVVDRPRTDSVETRHYRLHNTVFRVHYASRALCDAVHPLLEGLAAAAGPRQDIVANPASDVAVEPVGRAVSIVAAGREMGFAPSVDAAAVAVRATLTQLAVEQSGGLCVVHAGALARNGRALLLPGNAGRGKSTLSAGLAAAGFDLLSDDTTLLAGQPVQVAPLPTGLCTKRGAYPVLEPLFPRLAALPEWPRPDGLVAKYLMPGLDFPTVSGEATFPVRWIAFPHYDPGHATSLRPLSRCEALQRLLPGVYFLSGTLDAANLDAMIHWIEGVDCFELPLSSLDEAVSLLRSLCR